MTAIRHTHGTPSRYLLELPLVAIELTQAENEARPV